MNWNEAKANSDRLTGLIQEHLDENIPKSIACVIAAVKAIDEETSAIPNPNSEGQYCQLVLYPSPKWKTWAQTSMSISKYNLYY